MGSTPQPPTPPDPTSTARTQGQYNTQTALQQFGLNAANQVTPFGNLSYTQTGTLGGMPQFTATQTLSPEQQAAYGRQTQFGSIAGQTALDLARRAQAGYSQPFDWSTLPAAPTANLPDVQARVSAPVDLAATEARLTDLGRRRLDPLTQQREAALETSLRNQGVNPGTEAYARAKYEQAQAVNDAYNQLFLTGNQQAFGQGMDVANQQFGQQSALDQLALQRQAQQFGQQMGLRGNALQEQLAARNMPFGELSQLLQAGALAPPTAPGYINTPQVQVQAPDYQSAVNTQFAGQQNAYNQQMARQNAMYGALGSLGGLALGGWGQGGFKIPKFG